MILLLHVLKKPDPFTLARCVERLADSPVPEGFESMTVAEFEAWRDAELAAGWSPQSEPATPPVVPESVRNAQLRQWLLDRGLFDAVEAKLSNAAAWPDELTRRKAYQRWEYEPGVVRDDPLVLALGADLGMSSAQLDAAFIEIAAIP